ncbi:MAG TPA: TetR/AcrR family transcriptional regulator [Candidatus Marinimicrobia bacterium]|nr:TetR/AcrR family transcriptional regulator [Candidatus Neomarinimicrobiota bacterium]
MSTDETTKEKIIEVAIECFGENSYDGTSMRMIAEKSGVSKPAIYYYFPDKEQLFQGIFTYVMEKFRITLQSIKDSNKNAVEKLKEIFLIRCFPVRQNVDIKRFMSRVFLNGAKNILKLDHQKYFREHEKIILEIIQQGIDEGSFRSDINTRYFLYSLIGAANLFTRNQMMSDSPPLNREQVNALLTQLITGVGK